MVKVREKAVDRHRINTKVRIRWWREEGKG